MGRRSLLPGRACEGPGRGPCARRRRASAAFLLAVVGLACADVAVLGAAPGSAAFSGAGVAVKLFLFLVLAVVGLLAFIFVAQFAVCKLIVESIKAFDQKLLGVDVDFGSVYFNLFTGRVSSSGFRISNVKGYKEPYLMIADTFIFDLNVSKLFRSKGSDIEVEEFQLKNVDVILEYEGGFMGIGGKSNAMAILETVQSHLPKKQETDGKKPEKPSAKPSGSAGTVEEKTSSRKVTVRKLYIVDVGAKVSLDGKFGARNACADITYENFSAETAEQTGGGALKDILIVISNSLLKSIMASVKGKAAADKAY
mmetsp:Transcript_7643/g.21628  ORF Transcript_7643/g.21628 Transcript_7643/m.21628 type:complete len:311 (+) Transcript_7643:64-996(+)